MSLTDLIKALTDVLAEVGDCPVGITTENETKIYDTVLLHVAPIYVLEGDTTQKELVLRMEAIEEGGEDNGNEDE